MHAGIDVALLYHPKYFIPEKAAKLFIKMPGNSKTIFYTRDIVYVKGILAGETVPIYLNHWPSRRGGEEKSLAASGAAAMVCKKHISVSSKKTPMPKLFLWTI